MLINTGYVASAWGAFLKHYNEEDYKFALKVLEELERDSPRNEGERAERDMVLIEGYKRFAIDFRKKVIETERETARLAEKAEKYDELADMVRDMAAIVGKK